MVEKKKCGVNGCMLVRNRGGEELPWYGQAGKHGASETPMQRREAGKGVMCSSKAYRHASVVCCTQRGTQQPYVSR